MPSKAGFLINEATARFACTVCSLCVAFMCPSAKDSFETVLCMYFFACLISQSRMSKCLLLEADYFPQATDCLSENRRTEDV